MALNTSSLSIIALLFMSVNNRSLILIMTCHFQKTCKFENEIDEIKGSIVLKITRNTYIKLVDIKAEHTFVVDAIKVVFCLN